MITDHSSIGFEFCVLDRPLIVFDVPGLAEAARINPDKIALLRSAATVVRHVDDVASATATELAAPGRLSRRQATRSKRGVLPPGSCDRSCVEPDLRDAGLAVAAVCATGRRSLPLDRTQNGGGERA